MAKSCNYNNFVSFSVSVMQKPWNFNLHSKKHSKVLYIFILTVEEIILKGINPTV